MASSVCIRGGEDAPSATGWRSRKGHDPEGGTKGQSGAEEDTKREALEAGQAGQTDSESDSEEDEEEYQAGHQKDEETKGATAEEEEQKEQGASDAQEVQKGAVLQMNISVEMMKDAQQQYPTVNLPK